MAWHFRRRTNRHTIPATHRTCVTHPHTRPIYIRRDHESNNGAVDCEHAIRAAVIADPYTDSPTIKHFQALPLPVGAVVDGEVVDAEVVTGLLKTLVQRFKFPRENTILVYSSRRMVFRETDFPYMSLADLRSTLPFQAKGMIPLPIEESELDFVPLSVVDDEQNGKQLHGILVATLRGGLEKTAYTAEEAGFVITSIDAGPFALARLFSDTNQAQTEAVVNINGNCTDVIVLNNGKPAYMRVVPSGADDVSDAIANALSISFEDAERIKNQIGLQNVTGDERLEKAEEVIRETTAQLIVGIRNTLNMYDVDHADSTISGIILTGTGARLIGLPPVLAGSINKMVRIGDPFIRFKLSKEVERQNIVAHAVDLGGVLGLVIGKKPR
ncbi:type IV pilus assembly protein PilM [Bifidobacterium adolescentis]|uniref:type IV pilus assembly protein PilM n=1 Tax=Bifidobacterium adolescentis TaxID=1680 RepID=UPI0020CAF93D|nr:type IV pilus assembly protein PilM [Bifidobacterium adolescentis]